MASALHPCILLLFSSFLSLTDSSTLHQRRLLQSSNSPQNIETFFPSIASPAFINQKIPPPPQPPTSQPASTEASNSSDRNKITKAVVATAACSFAISFLIFYVFHWFSIKKHRQGLKVFDSQRGSSKQGRMMVDDNGLDLIYWRNLAGSSRCNYCNGVFDRSSVDPSHQQSLTSSSDVKYDRKVQEQPLIPLNSDSSFAYAPKASDSGCSSSKSFQSGFTPIAPPPPPVLPPPPPPPPSPPLPPPKVKKNLVPPPAMPPRPPPTRNSMAVAASSRAPLVPPLPAEGGRGRAKLKPLHWDKVTPPNAEHSMVWDRISDGSFRIDDDLMDTLFGYSSTNQTNSNSNKRTPSRPSSTPSATEVQTILLDPRKSQNIAIVVRSLGIGHKEIVDALLNGHGLNIEALEKLSRMALTKEEETKILNFTDNPKNLADAESFLYHLLKSVPSPSVRINAMLFKSNYDSEILHLKKSIQTLELASKEIKSHSLFLKLLEAILKAGNRMNAGTARGNAKAFNLSALCKLSDVKSTDGKSTLLHFVVEEVVRSEGKRLVINRNHSLRRSGSSSSDYSGILHANKTTKEDKEKEYIRLGLPVVGGLSEELVNVKKAAAIDYDTHVASCSLLGAKISELREFLRSCNVGDGFLKEMKGFLEASEEELKVVTEELNRVMELVKRTTEYYQPGSSKDRNTQALQLFVIIRDFLVMFDRVCIDITRNMQKKVVPKAKEESEKRQVAMFRNLPPRFMSGNSKSSSSDSDPEDGF